MIETLPPSFFARPTLEVAPALLGQTLVRRKADGSLLLHEIIEVEGKIVFTLEALIMAVILSSAPLSKAAV